VQQQAEVARQEAAVRAAEASVAEAQANVRRAQSTLDDLVAGSRPAEQQRLAVARAVVNDPAVILADEPTASLDTQRGKAVMDLLRQLGREREAAVIAVTHDERMIEGFDRVYHMVDGRIDRS
jgi:putative ABC transport system ATP-binding protein